MSIRIATATSCLAVSLMLVGTAVAAEKVKVKIVDRQTSDTTYAYVVPGSLIGQSNSNASCYGFGSSVNCSGSTTTTGSIVPPRPVSYAVRGATFSLLVPDGRIVVVNCESKYAPRGDYINRRSCRVPLVDHIVVEFDRDNAKLIWPVSLDGKKTQSETYKILAIVGQTQAPDRQP